MKKIFLMAATAVLALTSCEDFLDSQDYTGKNSTNFPTTNEDVDKMVAAVYKSCFYGPFQGNNLEQYFSVANIMSDDMFGGAGLGDPWWQAIDKLMYAQTNQMSDLWTYAYETIARANSALNVIDNIADEDARNQTKGELLFMRAYSYYNLVLAFNNVPIIEKAPETVAEAQEAPKQVEGKEVFKRIADDLYLATSIMPGKDKGYEYKSLWSGKLAFGKVSRWAAEAFLGRAFLFYTGFYGESSMPMTDGKAIEKAYVEEKLKDCIENSGHSLLKDYRSLWAYSNKYTAKDYEYVKDLNEADCYQEGNAEVLLAINFQYQSAWSSQLHLTNQYGLFFGIRSDNNEPKDSRYYVGNDDSVYPFGGGWGCGTVATNLVNDWKKIEPDDPRREASILDMSKTTLDPGTFSDAVELSMYHQKKITSVRSSGGNRYSWSLDAMGADAAETGNYQASNCTPLTIYRLADVYLMYAELTKDATYLNKVRERVGLPAVAYSEEALRNERRWELAFEGSRWDDLRRWGIAAEALSKQNGQAMYNLGKATTMTFNNYAERYNATKGFYRIPKNQIELSGGVYVQNKGWEDDAANQFAGY
ncbi:MAG: RagB/SusD family nutrient uptake outer membrane protein [Bacteroidales bacterium]|nr:RagB/SusD family nutrient uptake outer membrane protein [Bacteroidales bacterium]